MESTKLPVLTCGACRLRYPNLATEVASQATDKVMRWLELSCRTRLEFDRGVSDGMGMESTKMGGFRTMHHACTIEFLPCHGVLVH